MPVGRRRSQQETRTYSQGHRKGDPNKYVVGTMIHISVCSRSLANARSPCTMVLLLRACMYVCMCLCIKGYNNNNNNAGFGGKRPPVGCVPNKRQSHTRRDTEKETQTNMLWEQWFSSISSCWSCLTLRSFVLLCVCVHAFVCVCGGGSNNNNNIGFGGKCLAGGGVPNRRHSHTRRDTE